MKDSFALFLFLLSLVAILSLREESRLSSHRDILKSSRILVCLPCSLTPTWSDTTSMPTRSSTSQSSWATRPSSTPTTTRRPVPQPRSPMLYPRLMVRTISQVTVPHFSQTLCSASSSLDNIFPRTCRRMQERRSGPDMGHGWLCDLGLHKIQSHPRLR